MLVLQRYEDTELSDLKPLPTPKIVATPDGIANELFGDVAMLLEFIGCYRGLLMPDKSCRIPSAGMLVCNNNNNNNKENVAIANALQLKAAQCHVSDVENNAKFSSVGPM